MKGVAQNFLQLLRGDLRAASRRIWVVFGFAVALTIPAYLLVPPMGALWHWLAVVLAMLAGLIWGHLHNQAMAVSVKDHWNRWMRFAVSCETIPEVHRKVRGRSNRNLPLAYAMVMTLAWVGEIALLVFAFSDPASPWVAVPVVVVNGAVFGAMMGYYVMGARWYRSFLASLRDMVDEGEVPVWGVI